MRKQARIFMVLLGVILVLGLGLGLAGCKDEDDSNPFVGTYTGNIEGGHVITLVVAETTWEVRVDGDLEASGTYTYSGNIATMKQEGVPDQTATLSGKTLTAVFNGETFTLTKN
ncbi:MAG: hypothetical protein LBL56_04420 [Treponema sp.]|jgi:uncharacterized lipoprotein YehR (DUF1307 family)|nr:hypothetical protein [Treponema sp.]